MNNSSINGNGDGDSGSAGSDRGRGNSSDGDKNVDGDSDNDSGRDRDSDSYSGRDGENPLAPALFALGQHDALHGASSFWAPQSDTSSKPRQPGAERKRRGAVTPSVAEVPNLQCS